MSQRQLRNVQKSKMHVQSCCFANLKLFFAVLVAVTMVTLRHTSPPYLLLRYFH